MGYDYARDEEIASGRSTTPPHFVTTGHSRSQSGVASLAYAGVVHADLRLAKW
jgi:hypothetical protein